MCFFLNQNNNTPAIACKHATQALWKTGFSEDIKIHYTQQRTPLYPIIINNNSYHDNSYKEELSSLVELQNVELQNTDYYDGLHLSPNGTKKLLDLD